MWFDGPLASLSVWVTYFLQVVLVYLTLRFICSFIQNARTRVRIWGAFLASTTGMWIYLWIPAGWVVRFTRYFGLCACRLTLACRSHCRSRIPGFLTLPGSPRSRPTFIYSFCWRRYSIWPSDQRNLGSVCEKVGCPRASVQLVFRRLCLELNVNRCVLVLTSGPLSPATCFWWRSHVLLPLELVPELNSDQLDDVLRHELIHVRQLDYLWDRLAALGCRLVFFHPLVWLGYRHFRWERELACDFAVVRERTEARVRYAECLTRLARWLMVRNEHSSGIRLLLI